MLAVKRGVCLVILSGKSWYQELRKRAPKGWCRANEIRVKPKQWRVKPAVDASLCGTLDTPDMSSTGRLEGTSMKDASRGLTAANSTASNKATMNVNVPSRPAGRAAMKAET